MTTTASPPRVLFVCVSNAGKSPMAEALMHQVAGAAITATSAGTAPKTAVNAVSAQALAEVGADISAHVPQALTAEAIAEADLVVILGEEARPHLPAGTAVQRWSTDEPSTRGIEGLERMRIVREDITARVLALREELLQR